MGVRELNGPELGVLHGLKSLKSRLFGLIEIPTRPLELEISSSASIFGFTETGLHSLKGSYLLLQMIFHHPYGLGMPLSKNLLGLDGDLCLSSGCGGLLMGLCGLSLGEFKQSLDLFEFFEGGLILLLDLISLGLRTLCCV